MAYTPQVTPEGRVRWGNDPSSSEYDDTVIALGLAVLHPDLGPTPRYVARSDGRVYDSFAAAPDPY